MAEMPNNMPGTRKKTPTIYANANALRSEATWARVFRPQNRQFTEERYAKDNDNAQNIIEQMHHSNL